MLDNSVTMLEQAICYAKSKGIQIRKEVLDGAQAGYCRIGNRSFVFLDQSATAAEQLAEIMKVLRSDSKNLSVNPSTPS